MAQGNTKNSQSQSHPIDLSTMFWMSGQEMEQMSTNDRGPSKPSSSSNDRGNGRIHQMTSSLCSLNVTNDYPSKPNKFQLKHHHTKPLQSMNSSKPRHIKSRPSPLVSAEHKEHDFDHDHKENDNDTEIGNEKDVDLIDYTLASQSLQELRSNHSKNFPISVTETDHLKPTDTDHKSPDLNHNDNDDDNDVMGSDRNNIITIDSTNNPNTNSINNHSIDNINLNDSNNYNANLMCLPLNSLICILQFVDIEDQYFQCRYVCRYWFHLLTWHQNLPNPQISQFLPPSSCKYILSSPFINQTARGNHAMILSSLGLGIYIGDQFHLMIDRKNKHHSKYSPGNSSKFVLCGVTGVNVGTGLPSDDQRVRDTASSSNSGGGGGGGLSKLNRDDRCQRIQLRHCKMDLKVKDLKAISRFLTVNQRVNLLDLSHCKLSDFKVELLAYGLKRNRSVKHLMMSNNNITASGCKYIGYFLQFNQTVDTLWIRSNQIGEGGLKWIAKGLHWNRNLKKLSLDQNQITNHRITWYQHNLSSMKRSKGNINPLSLENRRKFEVKYGFNTNSSDDVKGRYKSDSKSLDDDDSKQNLESIDKQSNGNYSINSNTDRELLCSMDTLCGFSVSPIVLNDNEMCTQSYIGNYSADRMLSGLDSMGGLSVLDEEKMDGVLMFAHLMTTQPQCALEVVSLRENEIDSIGISLMAKALIHNTVLKELHLSHNKVSDRGVFSIYSLLQYYRKHMTDCRRKYGLDVYVKTGNNVSQSVWTDIRTLMNGDRANGGIMGRIF